MYSIFSALGGSQAQSQRPMPCLVSIGPTARVQVPLFRSTEISSVFSFLRTTCSSNPQHEVDHDRQQQRNSQHSRTKAVVKSSLPSHADALGAPVESYEGVDHGHERDECEEARADLSDAVTEVEETDCEAAEDDGEVEP